MKLTIIAPVCGCAAGMDAESAAFLRPLLHPDTELEFLGLEQGFPSVESELHVAFNAPEVVRTAKAAWERGSDGIFVNCFDDPGVFACRELLPIPVLGGYQAAVSTARLLADRWAVITTDQAGILSEERKARAWDFRPAAIRAVDMGVLDLCEDHTALLDRLEAACRSLREENRVGAVVLGCTCMCAVAAELQRRLRESGCPITVVEPFQVGVTQLERLARLGCSNHVPDVALAMDKLKWYERI